LNEKKDSIGTTSGDFVLTE